MTVAGQLFSTNNQTDELNIVFKVLHEYHVKLLCLKYCLIAHVILISKSFKGQSSADRYQTKHQPN